MGSIIIVIPIGLATVILYLFLSPEIAGWFTWICMAVWNLFALIKSFSLYRVFLRGISLKVGEIVVMASQPFAASITLIVVICLLFFDYSKLHLLWFYPLVSLLFDFTVGKRALKKLEPFRKNSDNHQSKSKEVNLNKTSGSQIP